MYKVTASIPILALGSVLLASSIAYYILDYMTYIQTGEGDTVFTILWSGWNFIAIANFLAFAGVSVFAFGVILLTFGRAGRSLLTLEKRDKDRERIKEVISKN